MYKWIIYKTTCLVNNKIYVGQHKTKNINDGYLGSGKLLSRALKKYGVDNFLREVIEIVDNRDIAGIREEHYIALFNATDPKIGYNITIHAWGGQPISDEARKKISEKLSGTRLSEEHKNKLRKPKSPEAIKNMKIAAEKALTKRKGKKWFHCPSTLQAKQLELGSVPENWISGRPKSPGMLKCVSEVANKKRSEKMLGIAKSKIHRENIRKAMTGHPVSIETRLKISEGLKHEKNGSNKEDRRS